MFRFILLTVLLLTTSCSHLSKSSSNRDPNQVRVENNQLINWSRFTPVDYMPSQGMYKGQPVETTQKRAVFLLTEQEKINLGIPNDQLAFANFRHSGVFYIASIPGFKMDKNNNLIQTNEVVEKIIFSEKHWSAQNRKETKSVEVHSELSFFLNKNSLITLWYNQDQQTKLPMPRILNESVVYSVEAARPASDKNAQFFPGALGPHFALVFRVESNTERNQQHREDPERTIISNNLDFSGTTSRLSSTINSMDTILYNAILTSEKNQRQQTYQIATNNCTNNLFDLIDHSVKYNQEFDINVLKKEIKKFNKNEVPVLITFLKNKSQEAKKLNINLDSEFNSMVNELVKYNNNQIDTLEVSETFMLSFPGFLKGHLKARHLIE